MSFTPEQLDSLAPHDELTISSRRMDGSFSQPVITWFVRVGDAFYLRSVRGNGALWFRAAVQRGWGRIEIAGERYDCRFVHAHDAPDDAITEEFKRKYADQDQQWVTPTYTPLAVAATIHFDRAR